LDKDETLQRIFRAKRLRRKELSRLPFKKKIEILVQLQTMAKGVERHGGEKKSHVWTI
jgi:hypothetical protein